MVSIYGSLNGRSLWATGRALTSKTTFEGSFRP